MDDVLREELGVCITIESRGNFTTLEGVFPRVFIGRPAPDQPLVASRQRMAETIIELDSSTGELLVQANAPTLLLNGAALAVPYPPKLDELKGK